MPLRVESLCHDRTMLVGDSNILRNNDVYGVEIFEESDARELLMSVADLPERPAFQSLDPGLGEIRSAPVSRLAILALMLGIVSLSAVFSTSLLPLAMIAAAFSGVVVWRLSTDRSASGMWMAQLGLTLAILGAAWVITSTRTRNDYLYRAAAPHAQTFLNLLSAGNVYQAYELTKSEGTRQITGTDLQAYYENLTDYMAEDHVKQFLSAASTRDIMSHGDRSSWTVLRGESVSGHAQFRVNLVMADAAKPDKKKIAIALTRENLPAELGSTNIAVWHVNEAVIVPE